MNQNSPNPPRRRLEQLRRHWGWLTVLAVLALIVMVRLRLLNLPLERDEGEYAYAGQLILQGVPPYELAYNMKFPGVYVAYAVIMAVFGQTPAGIHLGVTCVTTLTALMLYWFGRRLLDETAGVVTATAYAVLAASPSLLGLAGHATHFCALFATAGLCLIWLAAENGKLLIAVAGGLMFGLAVLMKQQAAFLGLWGLVFLFWVCRRRQISRSERLHPVMGYCAGLALPLAVTCLTLWQMGVFERFWFWTICYAREYVSTVPLETAPLKLAEGFKRATSRCGLIWFVSALGLGLIGLDARLKGRRLALLGFALAAFLTTCPGFFFREQYFLFTLPALALLAGCAVSTTSRIWRQKAGGSRFRTWPTWAYLLVMAAGIFENRDIWFDLTPVQAARALYVGNPFVEAEPVAAFIRMNSAPGTQVAILGSEPEIYFLSHRRSATGYIYTFPLMEPQPFARQMQEEMIREIESSKPEFVVQVIASLSWFRRAASDPRLFDWWTRSYQTNYALVGAVVMNEPDETRYLWGAVAANCGGFPNGGMAVYRRKSP